MTIEELLDGDLLPAEVREVVRSHIAERRRVEEALRASEGRFRLLAEYATDVIWVRDLDLKLLYISPAVERLRGLSVEEAMAQSLEEAVASPSLALVKRTFAEQLAWARTATREEIREHSVVLEVEMNRMDGSTLWTEVRARVVCDPKGRPAKIIGISRDVSERRKAEQALRESEERFRRLSSAAFGGVAITDAGLMLDANQQLAEMAGYSLLELAGKPVLELVAPESRELVQRNMSSGNEAPYEFLALTKDGSVIPVEVQGASVPYHGREARMTAVRDISERRRAEEERVRLESQIQRAQKLESLGVLAGGVAHDFNNLLVAMLGHADMALAKLPHAHPSHGNLGSIIQAAERAAELARQMLAYSGQGHFMVEPTDLNALTRENLQLLEASVPKSVHLQLLLSDEVSPIDADRSQMQQLIMNLVLNGAEALGRNPGTVTVSTGVEVLTGPSRRYSRFTASELEAGCYVFLAVRDDGCGMDEATLSRIFDPFFTTKFVGRGLGLSAVLGIIRGHRGGLDVSSEPGKGTSVRILLPVLEAPAAVAAAAAAPDPRPVKGTLLVVDDEEVVREMVREGLQLAGMEVLAAESGAAGLACFEREKASIDLVLLDHSMPGMNGEETLRRLRALDPGARVVLTSGFGEEEATRRFEGLGLLGFIQKPYRRERLLAEIRRCLAVARQAG